MQPAIAPEKAIDKAIETYYTGQLGGLSEIVKGLETIPISKSSPPRTRRPKPT